MYIITFIFLLIFQGISNATVYYVSPTGNDSNDGLAISDANAWLTFQHAGDTVNPGDTVNFLSGTYQGASLIRGGTAGNPVTFQAYTGATVIIHPRDLTRNAILIPAGTTWTPKVASGTTDNHLWTSPTNSVVGPTTAASYGGLLRNHDYWFATSQFPNDSNISHPNSGSFPGHPDDYYGIDPWVYWDPTTHSVKISQTTDPTLDEWVAIPVGNGNESILIRSADYFVFDGLITEYAFDGIRITDANTAGFSSNHNIYRNMTSRYNGRRGFMTGGTALAPVDDHQWSYCTAHTNGEHGFKQGNNSQSAGGNWATNVTYTHCTAYNNGYDGFQVSNDSANSTITYCDAYDNGRNPCGLTAASSSGCGSAAANFDEGVTHPTITWDHLNAYSTGTRTYFASDVTNYRTDGFSFFGDTGILQYSHLHNNTGSGIRGIGSSTNLTNVVKNNISENNGFYNAEFSTLNTLSFVNNTTSGGGLGEIKLGSTTLNGTYENNAFVGTTGVSIATISTPLQQGAITIPNSATANITFGSTAYSFEWVGVLDAVQDALITAPRFWDKSDGGLTNAQVGLQVYLGTGDVVHIISTAGPGISEKDTITTTTVSRNVPLSIIGTWTSGGAWKVYINGVEASYSAAETFSSWFITDSARAVTLGNRSAANSSLGGTINRFRVWRNKALSGAEVTTVYGGGTATGLTGEYLFTEGSGTTLADTSGNANNGTLNAYATWSGTSVIFRNAYGPFSGTMDYNAWYNPDSTPFVYDTVSYNFANYKTASSQDAHSINTDFTSEFNNYVGGDYSITYANSPTLRNAGIDLSSVLTNDYIGTIRPQNGAFAIGAYEEPVVSSTGTTFSGVKISGVKVN